MTPAVSASGDAPSRPGSAIAVIRRLRWDMPRTAEASLAGPMFAASMRTFALTLRG